MISLIGVGCGDNGLNNKALARLKQAELVIGAPHQFNKLPKELLLTGEKQSYPSPLSQLGQLILPNKNTCLLASGDPLLYGVGAYLNRLFPGQFEVFTNTSSIQSAFARLGIAWQDAILVSLHGRPLSKLRSQLKNNRLYAILTDKHSYPQAIARELTAAGYDKSTLWVCEELGNPNENVREYDVASLLHSDIQFEPLHLTLIKTQGPGGLYPEFPGIKDDLFETGTDAGKGMITKKEVRLCALSLLAPAAGEIGWDVGAGCGGLAVEWARAQSFCTLYAIESNSQRLAFLGLNANKFGVEHNLRITPGSAPEALAPLPDPDCIYIGGSNGNLNEILDTCWSRLRPGGRLVAAGVTETTRASLIKAAERLSAEVEISEISVKRGCKLGESLLLRPQLAVLLVCWQKEN